MLFQEQIFSKTEPFSCPHAAVENAPRGTDVYFYPGGVNPICGDSTVAATAVLFVQHVTFLQASSNKTNVLPVYYATSQLCFDAFLLCTDLIENKHEFSGTKDHVT